MEPLSIVHLTTFLQGGAGRAIVDLACGQTHAGHDVLVVTSRTPEAGYGNYEHYIQRLAAADVPLIQVDSLFKRDPNLNRQVLEQLGTYRPADRTDLVHAHAATPARIARLYTGTTIRRVAVVQTQHGWGTNKTAEQARDDLAVLRAMDKVIVTSNATGDWLAQQRVDAGSIVTIPCGLPAVAPEPSLEARRLVEPLRRRSRYVVACIGSVTANKNQETLIRAIARTEDVAAVFVGEGGEALAGAARAVGVQDRVLSVGYRPDADAWLPLFDLLVVPSLTEGQGIVVLEAFRAGVPVAAADIEPLRLVVSEGETGWRFDPRRPDEIAAAIARARQTSRATRARIVAQARRRFENEYTAVRMIEEHEAVYQAARGRTASPEADDQIARLTH